GVLKALTGKRWGRMGYDPIAPYCVCGTSMGALNAAAFVSASDAGFADAANWLETVWLQRIGVATASSSTGVFRVRAEPTQVLDFAAMTQNPVTPVARLSLDMFHFMTHSAIRLAYAFGADGAFADRAAKVMELNEWIDHSPLEAVVGYAANPWRVATS